jgi:hypothetical protein
MATRRIVIEGWRGIHHSYALVAQAHALCLLERPDVEVRYRDIPYFSDRWQRSTGVLAAAQERAIAAIPVAAPDDAADVTWTLRPEIPDFNAPSSGRRFAFGTPEHRVLPREIVARFGSAEGVSERVEIITPSRWTSAPRPYRSPQRRIPPPRAPAC